MQYFKIGPGRFVQYDEAAERARILARAELVAERQALQERIATADPNQPKTNAEWIAWAKAHYPYVDHGAEIEALARIEAILEAIRDL